MTPGLGHHSDRANAIFAAHRDAVYSKTDRMFAVLMVVQWVASVAAAVILTPLTWIGTAGHVHVHVWLALILGGVLTAPTVLLAWRCPGSVLTRHVTAVAQAFFSALLIHLSGGRIETHFHIFGSLAFLAFYRDWRILITATIVVTADHFLRGTFWPRSAFGRVDAEAWRWIEHAAWVVFEDIFLFAACRSSVAEMRRIASVQARIEAHHAIVKAEVELATTDLRRANIAAEAASRAKGDFLANMSHEIRTPMTSILGYADLLVDDRVTPAEREEHVHTIRSQGEHLLSIINDILDVSKIEADRMSTERIPTSPLTVAEEVLALLRGRAAAKGIDLRCVHDWPIPASFPSDPLRLRQILINLIGNALKFTSSGNVTLLLSTDAPAGVVTFTVMDTGLGMTHEQVARLFKPFSQADETMSRRFGGTGMGLFLSKRFAELLGGTLTVTSSPGNGSTFSVALPFDPASPLLYTNPAAARSAALSTSPPPPARLDNRRILLAEDGPDNQRLLLFHLRRAGAEVVVADNGRVACELAAASKFDLVLMDMQMPELDGYDAAARLRREGHTLPIIALTAHAMTGDRERCLAAGCSDYLTKPIDKHKLLAACAAARPAATMGGAA